ncbi:hypothetical protein Emag_000165 [Eimeria magna]
MEPLIGGPTSPFRSNNTPLPPDSQQPRELSDFSFYKSVNAADCKALQSTYRRGKRSAEASKLKSLQTQDTFKRDALRTIIRSIICCCCCCCCCCCRSAAVADAAVAAADSAGSLWGRARMQASPKQFLTFSEFPGPLSAKALSSPQRSLLIDIWSHLFSPIFPSQAGRWLGSIWWKEEQQGRCFDDSVKLTADNVNDEVPRLFKEIGVCMGRVDWGVRTAERPQQQQHHQHQQQQQTPEVYAQVPFPHQQERDACAWDRPPMASSLGGIELAGRSDLVGRLMAAAYAQSGKDVHAVKASVLGQLHALNGEAEAAHQQLQQQLQQRQQQLAGVEAELRDNASLMVRKRIMRGFLYFCVVVAAQESRAAAAAAERGTLLQQQQELQREVHQLEDRIKAQGIDKAELERIRHDIARLREGLVHRTKEIEGLSEALQTLMDQVADDSEKLRIAGHSVSLHAALAATAAVAAAAAILIVAAAVAVAAAAIAAAAVADPAAVAVAVAAIAAAVFADAAAVCIAVAAAAAVAVNECISSIIQLAASAKLQTVEAWASLPKLDTFAAAAADNAAAAAVAAAAASCDIKRATNEILGVDWPALKTEMLRLMKLEEQAEAEEDLQQQQQQQQAELQQLEEAERQHLEGVREAKQQQQQEQQQLQHRVQQQQQLLQQEDRQQQQEAASAIAALQQQQREALQQKRQLLQQLQLLTETKHAECCAVEQQLLELREALAPSPKVQQHRVSSLETHLHS